MNRPRDGRDAGFLRVGCGLLVLLGLAGCAREIEIEPPPGPRVEALFDPPAVLPTPTDLARNRETGLLEIPPPEGATAAQAELDQYLNGLDGYPLRTTAELLLSGELSAAAARPENLAQAIRVLITDPRRPGAAETLGSDELVFGYHHDAASDRALITIAPATSWPRGRRIALFARGDKLTDGADNPVVRSATFELVAGRNPICLLEQERCVHNYSSLVASQVSRQVAADPTHEGKSHEELSRLTAAAALEAATQLERLRLYHDELLELAAAEGLARDEVVVAWGFSTISMTEALFDPAAGLIPGPANDLLIAAADDPEHGCARGKVCIPARAGESSEDAALRQGLNTLDGFSTSAPVWTTFSAPLDPATVDAESVVLLDMASPGQRPDVTVSYHEAEQAIVITPNRPLRQNARYAVFVLSAPAPDSRRSAGGLADLDGNRVVPSPSFLLARIDRPLVVDGASQISSLDHATATALEELRSAHEPLLAALPAIGVERQHLVVAWAFTTQSITEPLVRLRALPYQALASVPDSHRLSGTLETGNLDSFPAGMPREHIGAWVSDGRLTSIDALDPTTRALLPAERLAGESRPSQVPFIMTVPKGGSPGSGWPVVVFAHGIGSAKRAGLQIADRLAEAGFAMIAFDAPFHGDRTVCTADAHCDGGTCDRATGTCSSGALADQDADGIPDASGAIGPDAAFFDTSNPFAARDNLRQTVIDATALMRAIRLDGAAGLLPGNPGQPALDPAAVHFVGHSMGAMIGTMLLAVESLPQRAVLSAAGGPWVFGVATASEAFAEQLEALRTARNVAAGSLAELQLLSTLQWILDPADPAAFGSYLTADDGGRLDDPVASAAAGSPQQVSRKQPILIRGSADRTIPADASERLAAIIGVDTAQTTYAGQEHGLLLAPSPDPGATAVAQQQLVTFLETGQVCTPDVASQTCVLQ